MPTLKPLYGSNNQTITLPAGAPTLANGSLSSSAAIDNSTNLYAEILVTIVVTVGTVVAPAYVNVYVAGSTDGGTTYSDNAAASTTSTTLLSTTPNARLIGVINTPTNATAFRSHPMSVALAFGGAAPPDHLLIIIENKTGAALTAASANYQGIQFQSA